MHEIFFNSFQTPAHIQYSVSLTLQYIGHMHALLSSNGPIYNFTCSPCTVGLELVGAIYTKRAEEERLPSAAV